MADSRPGLSPAWNLIGFALAALVVAALVIGYAPTAPTPELDAPLTTEPAACQPRDKLCAATEALNDLEDRLDEMTPDQRDAFIDMADGLDDYVTGTTTPPPRPPVTSTTTTTTSAPPPTTSPPHPATPVDDLVDDLLGDLLGEQAPPTTSPEGADGDT